MTTVYPNMFKGLVGKKLTDCTWGFGHQFVPKSYPLMVVKSNLYPPSLKLFYLFLGI